MENTQPNEIRAGLNNEIDETFSSKRDLYQRSGIIMPADIEDIESINVNIIKEFTGNDTMSSRDLSEHQKILIGICGKMGSGKSTCAKYLKKEHGFTIRPFAFPLKEMARIGFGMDDEQLYGSKKETPDDTWFGITPRRIMQTLGTELFREKLGEIFPEIGQDFWIISMINWYRQCNENLVVIDDVRFPNEVKAIKDLGGIIIGINNLNKEEQSSSIHPSEMLEINDQNCDYIIDNRLDDTFFKSISDILEHIL